MGRSYEVGTEEWEITTHERNGEESRKEKRKSMEGGTERKKQNKAY
jgi:hypothetical protein